MGKESYSVDNIDCSLIADGAKINIRGWCCLDGKDDYKLHLRTIKSGEEIKAAETRLFRKDVVQVVEKHYPVEEIYGLGFILVSKLPLKAVEEGIVLYAKNKDRSFDLVSYTKEQLEGFSADNAIACSIDRKDIEHEFIIFQGWAIALSGEELNYELKDADGKDVPFELKRSGRVDINRMFMEDAFGFQAGFRVKFEDTGSASYSLVISSKDDSKTLEVTKKSVVAEVKKRERKYQDLKGILKATSPKTIAGDLKVLFTKGPAEFVKTWQSRNVNDAHAYDLWYRRQMPDAKTLKEQSQVRFEKNPRISLVVPAYHTPPQFLKQMVDSVQAQSYRGWELCIADGGAADDDQVEKTLKPYMQKDSRIKYKKLDANLGISGNTNAALEMANGAFFALLDHDDILAPDALYEVVKAINENPGTEVVYTDEDKVSMDLKTYFSPYFKSDFNRDLLRSNNYICHLFVVSKNLVKKVGMFDAAFDGSQDHDFILRCTESAKKVTHVRKVLYHWRMHQASTAENPESKMYCYEAGKRAVEAHLARCGVKGEVELIREYLGSYRVKYLMEGSPKVSVIIPNKDEKEGLKVCIDSILEKTTYENYEIIIVENNSTTDEIFEYYKELEKNPKIKVVRWEKEFNYSAINNFGVSFATGDYILLLNNDTEVMSEDWMERMIANLQREDIGCVGVKLFYPDMTLQHCGVAIGMGGIAGHVFARYPGDYMGGFGRALLQQDVSIVTAACLMVPRKVFDEVGGLEEKIKVAFNDVDFCLKIRDAGYSIMYEPMVYLKHYESKTRGYEDTEEKKQRFQSEVFFMEDKWGHLLREGDPFYTTPYMKQEKMI